jgi:hypothetical protein
MKKEKMLKGAYFIGNLALPLYEGKRILKAGTFAITQHRARLKKMKQQHEARTAEDQTFDEAVRDSGQTVAMLTGQYRLRKRLWLALTCLPLAMLLLLNVAALINGLAYRTLVWRLLSLDFMLLAFAGFCVVKAVQCQFRLWQLHTRTLGTFSTWRAQTRWLQDTLTWRTHRAEK